MIYLRILRPFLHIVIVLISFYVTYFLRQQTDLIPYIHIKIPFINIQETVIFAITASIIFVIIGFIVSLYKIKWPIHGHHRKLFKTWFIWFIVITFFAYFGIDIVFESWISRLLIVWGAIISIFIILIVDILINLMNNYFEKKDPYRILVITPKKKFYENIKAFFSKYKIYSLDYNLSWNIKKEKIKNYNIVFLVWNVDLEKVEEISDIARLNGLGFYFFPESWFLEDILYRPARLGPVITWEYKPSSLDGWGRVFKRIFDILFSIFILVLFSWLFVLVALFILIKDGRPIIYKSKRVGRWWKEFDMFKFRTMVRDADKIKIDLENQNEREGPLFKIKDDPRVLWWWKFLRKTSLDEIPQFWDILLGKMSVVWPRPHLQSEVENYTRWQKRVLSVKPGITGYAQIFGRDLPFDKEARLDLYWIQNWSVWMDLFVIIGTIKTIFKGK